MNENQPKHRYGDPHPTRRGADGRPWRWAGSHFQSPEGFDGQTQALRATLAIPYGTVRKDGFVRCSGWSWARPGSANYNNYVRRHGVPVYTGWTPDQQPAAAPAAPATYVFGGRAVSAQRLAFVPARPETEANLRHNAAASILEHALIAEHGKDNVAMESPTADGTEIDAVVRLPDGTFRIYEIKTAETAKSCIRQGLGQLLEYAKSPGMTAAGITVVGTVPPTLEDALYLDRLNKDHCLNITYRQVKGSDAV